MNEMIERGIVALKASIEGSPHNFGEAGIARVYEDAVRAVIAAMREPTEAMTTKGRHSLEPECHLFSHDAYGVWRAMIDAALKD